jgi:AcrR family transcriptional regulator
MTEATEATMGITERREREKEEVRKKILDAARELFEAEGYDKVTMRRIAEAIEYSPTTIYLHFEDKDDLVRALCHEDFGQLLEALSLLPPAADPVESIRQLGRAYVAFALENPNQFRFMFMSPAHKNETHGPGDPGWRSFGALLEAVERAVTAGCFRKIEPLAAAQILWMNVHGVASMLITLPGELWPLAPAARDLVEQVIENGIRGLLADPGKG